MQHKTDAKKIMNSYREFLLSIDGYDGLSKVESLIVDHYGRLGLQIYDLIDGQRTIGELVKRTGLSEFRLMHMLDFLKGQHQLWIDSGPFPPLWLSSDAELESVVRVGFGEDAAEFLRLIDGSRTWMEVAEKTPLKKSQVFEVLEFCEHQKVNAFVRSLKPVPCASSKAADIMQAIRKDDYVIAEHEINDAITDLEKIILKHVEDNSLDGAASGFYNLGLCFLLRGCYQLAGTCFSLVVRSHSNIKEAMKCQGFVFELLGMEAGAIDSYAGFLKSSDDSYVKARLIACEKKKTRNTVRKSGPPTFSLRVGFDGVFSVPRKAGIALDTIDFVDYTEDQLISKCSLFAGAKQRIFDSLLVYAVEKGELEFPFPPEKIIEKKFGTPGLEVYDLIHGVKTVEEIRNELNISKEKIVDMLNFMVEEGIICMGR